MVVRLTKKQMTERMRKLAPLGAAAAKKILKPADWKRFGRMGGRPKNPQIALLMEKEGLTRAGACYRLKHGVQGSRIGRPRLQKDNTKKRK